MYRIRVFFAGLVIAFLVIWMRLAYWQVVMYDDLSSVAFAQYTSKIHTPAFRGEIWSADNFPLVVNKPFYRVTADPTLVSPDERIKIADELTRLYSGYVDARDAAALQSWQEASASARLVEPDEATESAALEGEEIVEVKVPEPTLKPESNKFDDRTLRAQITEMLADQNRRWVSLLDRVPEEIKQQIEEHEFKGVFFEQHTLRAYPDDAYAGYVSGFLHSTVDGETEGAYGLEAYYNGILKGVNGRKWLEKTIQGYPIPVSHSQEIDSEEGYTLKLHINRALQADISRLLEEGVKKYGALRGDVVVMDPHTGGVLAMVSYPSFRPSIWSYAPADSYINPAIAKAYEPGSTFKVMVMAAGIDAKVVTPTTRCPVCNGPRKIGPHYIRTWNNQYRDNPTMTEVLVNSDNTGMVYIGDLLGQDRLYQYVQKFGFGSKSGIDLQEDAAAPLRKLAEMREIDAATMTFGQGLAVTPIQMVRAVSAIANGGRLPVPRVVHELVRDDQASKLDTEEWERVISEESARVAKEMMKESAAFGEAKFAYLKGYSIAGKTGTAQVAIEGVYDEKKTIASFIGFAPADDPKFVMLVKLDEPTSSPWGSETAAPLWFAIAKDILRYYGIMPEK